MLDKAISRMQAVAHNPKYPHRFPAALIKCLEKELRYEGILEKGHSLIKPGEVCDKLWYILKGSLKCSIYRKKEEHIIEFFQQKDIVSSLTSFIRDAPTREHIVTLEPTEVISIEKKTVRSFTTQFPEFAEFWCNLIARFSISDSRARITEIKMNAHDQYDLLAATYPKLIDRLDINDIAAYLGVSSNVASNIKSERAGKSLKVIPYNK